VVANHFVDDEAQEFLGEFGVEIGLFRQFAQPCDLALFARGIGGRQGHARLVFAYRLSDPEPLGEHVNDRRVDIVDAFAIGREHGVERGRGCALRWILLRVGSVRVVGHGLQS